MLKLILGLSPILFFTSACQKEHVKEKPFEPGYGLTWQLEAEKATFKPLEGPRASDVFAAPNYSKQPERISGFENNAQLSKNVSVKVIRSWEEGKDYVFLVSLKNDSSKGTRAKLYMFSYDETGKILNSTHQDVFFNANESFFKRVKFPKLGQVAHWSIAVI